MKTAHFLTILVINLLLHYGLSRVNSAISYGGVSLNLDVLYLVFAVFYMPLGKGIIYTVIMGLLVSSSSCFVFGTEMFVFLVVYLVWKLSSRTLNANTMIDVRGSSLIAGFAIAVLYTIMAPGNVWSDFSFWHRFLTDSLLSILCIYLLSFRYCELQRNLLRIENKSFAKPGNAID